MSRVTVHVGLDKTGTTTLQATLSQATETLAEAGYIYPRTGCESQHHIRIAHALGFGVAEGDPAEAARLKEALDRECSASQHIVLSSEHFTYNYYDGSYSRIWSSSGGRRTPPAIQALRSFFREHDVTIVIYLRNQIGWVVSLYGEAMKWGNTPAFTSYLERNLWRLHFDRIILPWSAAFGRNNVVVRTVEEGDVLENFLSSVLRIDPLQTAHRAGLNVMPSQLGMEAFRLALLDARTNNPHAFERATTVYQTFVAMLPYLSTVEKQFAWPLPDALTEELDILEHGNRRLAQRFTDRQHLFPEPLRHYADTYEKRRRASPANSASISRVRDELLVRINDHLNESTDRSGASDGE